MQVMTWSSGTWEWREVCFPSVQHLGDHFDPHLLMNVPDSAGERLSSGTRTFSLALGRRTPDFSTWSWVTLRGKFRALLREAYGALDLNSLDACCDNQMPLDLLSLPSGEVTPCREVGNQCSNKTRQESRRGLFHSHGGTTGGSQLCPPAGVSTAVHPTASTSTC